MERRLEATGRRRFVLVGYSFGAVIAFVLPDLPEAVRARIDRVVLIAPADRADLRIHPRGWLDGHGPDDQEVGPAIGTLAAAGFDVLVLYGARDRVRAAPPRGAPVRVVTLPGGHALGRAYRRLAALVLGEAA